MAQKPPARGKKGDPLIGAVVERRWRIIDQIGSGGMGAVYRAERVQLGKQVALKFLHASVVESKSAVARFEREAKAISRLHHVNCVSILDFGVYRKQPYIVMEFVEGRQLTELDPDTLTPGKGVAILRQILLGLAHAHGRGVIHRDLKLSNVMLVEMTGTEELVKLLDFGLARLTGGVDVEKSLTHEGFVAGTPTYMSPEQCLGKTVDQRSDLYSAGVVLYTLCTGTRPFFAEETAVLLHKQIHEAPMSPRKVAPQKRISESLERVILHALEKRPEARFQTALDFLRALDATPEGQATQTPTVARIKPRRFRRRLLLIAALACVAFGAFGALYVRAKILALREKMGKLEMFQKWRSTPDAGVSPAPRPQKLSTKAAPPPAPAPAPPPPRHVDAQVVHELPDAAATYREPEPLLEPAKAAPAPARAVDTSYRQEVERHLVAKDFEKAKQLLRDHPSDPWAHLKLGNLYALWKKPLKKDAFREWERAFTMDPSLRSDHTFHRELLCESIDSKDRNVVEVFFDRHFHSEQAEMLMSCLQKPSLDCPKKKAAIEMLANLHYTQARSVLEKLARQEPKARTTPQFACFDPTTITNALEKLK